MKILMLAPGRSIHSQRPLKWLLESGHDVTFVDLDNPCAGPRERYQFIPRPHAKWTRYSGTLLSPKLADEFSNWTVAVQLRRLWKRIRPDVVHVHWVDRRAYHCVKAGLKPLVLSVWGTDINRLFSADADPRYRRMIGHALAGADRVIVDAPDMFEKCSLLAGDHVHMDMLPLGVDTKAFTPGYQEQGIEWRRRLNIPPAAAVLLSIRAWEARYGHQIVLEAFQRALGRFARPGVLVFKTYNPSSVQEGVTYEGEMRSLAEQLGIADSVRWMHEVPHDRLPELYALADMIVNYPSMDAFPVTFLEAAACERPVLSVRLPAYKGTFAEDYFRMVEPGSVDDLADAMVELVNEEPERRTRRLSRARQVVRDEYDERATTRRLLDIYQGLRSRRISGYDNLDRGVKWRIANSA